MDLSLPKDATDWLSHRFGMLSSLLSYDASFRKMNSPLRLLSLLYELIHSAVTASSCFGH
eukprot:3776161-Ditylum_brightwellii.AAC.2